MKIIEVQDQLVKEFEELESWEDKYSKIIKFGRELPAMTEEHKTEKNK